MLKKAKTRCDRLKKFPFNLCGDKVDIQLYFNLCVHDLCKLFKSGDNVSQEAVDKMICYYIEMYAYECAVQGVVFQFRSQDLCRKYYISMSIYILYILYIYNIYYI